jgi:predicted anti-sigma-YlaC factor YlaD
MSDRDRPGLAVDCTEVVELVTDYLEGVLPPVLAAEVEAHLALCDGCDAYLDQMRRTIDELGRVPVESLSDTAKADLVETFRVYNARQHPPGGPAAKP